MAWDDIGATTNGDFGKASWANKVRANDLHIAAADGTLNQTGIGTQVATAALVGFMSAADKTKLDGLTLNVKSGTYTGDGTPQEITTVDGTTIAGLIIMGYEGGKYKLWIVVGSAQVMRMETGISPVSTAQADNYVNLNSSSAGRFTVGTAAGGPSDNTQVYSYVAFFG